MEKNLKRILKVPNGCKIKDNDLYEQICFPEKTYKWNSKLMETKISISNIKHNCYDMEQMWQLLELNNSVVHTMCEKISFLKTQEKLATLVIPINNKQIVHQKPVNTVKEEFVDESFSTVYEKQKCSEFDDNFFNLDEMEEFLNEEENRKLSDEIDFFQDNENDVENVDDRDITYNDFYEQNSSMEGKQNRLNATIQHFENNNLKKKAWQLTGVVNTSTRPQNSLLEEVLEFDSTTSIAPLVTEITTEQLESIIKHRITNNLFDDVVAKTKIFNEEERFKNSIVLNQTKSSLPLAKVYENDFHKTVDSNQCDNKIGHKLQNSQIWLNLNTLTRKLESLSNFHFQPTHMSELKIITNVPLINIENVAPTDLNTSQRLAPEEVFTPNEKRNNKPGIKKLRKKTENKTRKQNEQQMGRSDKLLKSKDFFSKLQNKK